MRILQKALDIALPPRCIVSGEEVDSQGMVAPHIWSSLRFISPPYCACCGLPFSLEVEDGALCASCLADPPPFDALRSALVYDEGSKDMVLRFKHGDQIHNAVTFTPWLRHSAADMLETADILVPVPLHRWRFLKRRYNQAAVMAIALGRSVQKPCIPDLLLRVRATSTQGHKSAKEREQNVKNAFRMNPLHAKAAEGKTVMLIDDVYTTGATIKECAKVLKNAGAGSVHVLTLTRAVREG